MTHPAPAREKDPQRTLAAHARWARCSNRAEALQSAHEGLERRIAEQYGIPVDAPDYGVRIVNARKAYFGALALKSATARRKARELIDAADAAEAELAEAAIA